MEADRYDALILAGGKVDNFAVTPKPAAKGLIEIAGRPMISYVLEALRAVDRIERLVVLVPMKTPLSAWSRPADKVIFTDDLITKNISKGLDYLGPVGDKFMLISSDIPLISPEALNNFLDLCRQIPADVHYPIIKRSVVENRFPSTKRTYMKLKDGEFTGGNIFLIDKSSFLRNQQRGEEIFSYRKSPFKMVGLLGLRFVFKFFLRTLKISELEETASRALSCRLRAVISNYPEIGVDVDKQADLELFTKLLNQPLL